jgi:ATP-binding cassette subfamily C protein
MKKYIFRSKALFLTASIFTIFDGALSASMAILLKLVLDAATSGNLSKFRDACIWVVAFLFAFALMGWFARHFKAKYIGNTICILKADLFNNLIETPFRYFHKKNTAEYISMFNNDVKLLETDYFDTVFSILRNVVIMILSLIMMLYIQPLIAFVAIILSLIPMIIPKMFSNKLSQSKNDYSFKTGRYNVILKDILTGFSVIKGYSIEKKVTEMHHAINIETESKKVRSLTVKANADVLTNFSAVGMQFSVYLLAGYFILNGQFSAGSTIAIVQLMNKVVLPVFDIVEKGNQMISVSKVSERLLESATFDASDNKIAMEQITRGVVFRNTSFKYETSAFLLDSISVSFEKGKKYAVLGESGSGKSTFLSLLLGHNLGYDGEIYIDDVEMKKIDETSVPRLFATVAQTTFLFEDTVYNNITLFKDYPENQVSQVVNLVGLDVLVKRLENGLSSGVSENGMNISGGEKQRIALARALLRGCDWIVLDEAMSNLDNETTEQIENLLVSLPGVTCISVMHRVNPSLLRMYNKILDFNSGKLINVGTYDELNKSK